MNYDFSNGCVKITDIDSFSVSETFECGQCFRFNRGEDGVYRGVAFGRVLQVIGDENSITLLNTSKEDFTDIWKSFFDLEQDYLSIKNNLVNIHPMMEQAYLYASGIRILHQDPYEALISFIISQNNNIPRIKGIVERLCENFGEKIDDGYYSFPSNERLSKLSEEDLGVLRCGFRAKYIIDAARKIASGEVDLQKIASAPIDDARKMLMTVKGVGPKVAECTLLYGMHRLECFPMDVWMKRAMESYFPTLTPQSFGKYAGIAQQYIFHYSRNNMT